MKSESTLAGTARPGHFAAGFSSSRGVVSSSSRGVVSSPNQEYAVPRRPESVPPRNLCRSPGNPGVRCRVRTSRRRPPRIEEATATWLVEKSDESPDLSARRRGDRVAVTVDGHELLLSRDDADQLRASLADALTAREAFLNTAGEHRADGKYVVERRGADSAGNRKVFDSFDALRRLFERLPEEFTAEDLSATGLTAGRRHMVLWHLVEHPRFACELAARQPLTARKHAGATEVES